MLQWLRKVPGVAEALPADFSAHGSLDAKLHYSGGYGDALRQLQQAGLLAKLPEGVATKGAQSFALEATVNTPQLTVRTSNNAEDSWQPVSYTHLDVYKRQPLHQRRHERRHHWLDPRQYLGS